MKFIEFLNKETPSYGGCMLCLATYDKREYSVTKDEDVYKERQEYLLIERHKCANGDIWTINSRPYYDYEFVWVRKVKDWEILYKKEA